MQCAASGQRERLVALPGEGVSMRCKSHPGSHRPCSVSSLCAQAAVSFWVLCGQNSSPRWAAGSPALAEAGAPACTFLCRGFLALSLLLRSTSPGSVVFCVCVQNRHARASVFVEFYASVGSSQGRCGAAVQKPP